MCLFDISTQCNLHVSVFVISELTLHSPAGLPMDYSVLWHLYLAAMLCDASCGSRNGTFTLSHQVVAVVYLFLIRLIRQKVPSVHAITACSSTVGSIVC